MARLRDSRMCDIRNLSMQLSVKRKSVKILNGKLVFRTANIVHFHRLIFKDRRNVKFISDSVIEN